MLDGQNGPRRLQSGVWITVSQAGAELVRDGIGLVLEDAPAVTGAIAARLLAGTGAEELSACGAVDGDLLLGELAGAGLLTGADARFQPPVVEDPAMRLQDDVTCSASHTGLMVTHDGWCAGGAMPPAATARILAQLFEGFSAASLAAAAGDRAGRGLFERLGALDLLQSASTIDV